MADGIKIAVVGGMCQLSFRPWVSTGPTGSDASPGVGFEAIADGGAMMAMDGKIHFGMGVISRPDAARLRDMLEIFLKNHAAGVRD